MGVNGLLKYTELGTNMNEKIKELYDQSQKVSHYIDGGYTAIMTLDAEKFAELIVLECTAYLNVAAEVYDQKDQDTVDRAARHIKEYLGVE